MFGKCSQFDQNICSWIHGAQVTATERVPEPLIAHTGGPCLDLPIATTPYAEECVAIIRGHKV